MNNPNVPPPRSTGGISRADRALSASVIAANVLLLVCIMASPIWIARADPPASTGMNPQGQFIIATRAFNNAPARTMVTVAAAANGYQVSASRDADVRYSLTITGTATIGGNCTGSVVLEICPTNSATAADWLKIAEVGQGQSFGVVVGISCTQSVTSSLRGSVPAGYYARLRSISTAGTPTFAITAGQEILL